MAAGVGVSRAGALVAAGAGVDCSGRVGETAVGMRVGDRSVPAAPEQATRARAAIVVAMSASNLMYFLFILVPAHQNHASNNISERIR